MSPQESFEAAVLRTQTCEVQPNQPIPLIAAFHARVLSLYFTFMMSPDLAPVKAELLTPDGKDEVNKWFQRGQALDVFVKSNASDPAMSLDKVQETLGGLRSIFDTDKEDGVAAVAVIDNMASALHIELNAGS